MSNSRRISSILMAAVAGIIPDAKFEIKGIPPGLPPGDHNTTVTGARNDNGTLVVEAEYEVGPDRMRDHLVATWEIVATDYLRALQKRDVSAGVVRGLVADRLMNEEGKFGELWRESKKLRRDAWLREAFPGRTRYGL